MNLPSPTSRARRALSPSVTVVTPAWADANNGNWQTAQRWARHLAGAHAVHLVKRWEPTPDGAGPEAPAVSAPKQALVALHAVRSAASIDAWYEAHGSQGLGVLLTGTDLYRDLLGGGSAGARALRSLHQAARVAVLQEAALDALPADIRTKTSVIHQSCSTWAPRAKPDTGLRVVVVGHLRAEKDPETVWAVAQGLAPDEGIRIDHYGVALEAELGAAARRCAQACPHYRWHGGVSHRSARLRLAQAHVLLHPSRMEGGAHVVMEAICSGTAVLGSDMAGNVGLLGTGAARQAGAYFPVGDAAAAVRRLRALRDDRAALRALEQAGAARAALFAPRREAASVRAWVAALQE